MVICLPFHRSAGFRVRGTLSDRQWQRGVGTAYGDCYGVKGLSALGISPDEMRPPESGFSVKDASKRFWLRTDSKNGPDPRHGVAECHASLASERQCHDTQTVRLRITRR